MRLRDTLEMQINKKEQPRLVEGDRETERKLQRENELQREKIYQIKLLKWQIFQQIRNNYSSASRALIQFIKGSQGFFSEIFPACVKPGIQNYEKNKKWRKRDNGEGEERKAIREQREIKKSFANNCRVYMALISFSNYLAIIIYRSLMNHSSFTLSFCLLFPHLPFPLKSFFPHLCPYIFRWLGAICLSVGGWLLTEVWAMYQCLHYRKLCTLFPASINFYQFLRENYKIIDDKMLTGSILCGCWADNYTEDIKHEFKSTKDMSFIFDPLDFTFLSIPLLLCVLSLRRTDIPFGAECSPIPYCQHFGQLWISILTLTKNCDVCLLFMIDD